MTGAVRLGDSVSCGDVMAQGSGDVFINGMPAVRVMLDLTAGHCFNPTTVATGSPTVFINGKPAARVGDPITEHCCPGVGCHSGTLATGSPNVIIN